MIPAHLVEREEMNDETFDLQAIRKEVAMAKKQQVSVKTEDAPVTLRKVVHSKYGVGIVVDETDDSITVRFDGYGEKQFLKAFSGLEDLM